MARWLTSSLDDQKLLGETVAAVLKEKQGALPWFGEQLAAAAADPVSSRAKGLQAVATHVVLEFLRHEQKSGIVFAGQYEPLRALQPFAGRMLFRLLLETPDWYPDTHRKQLVPALRDVQPTLPEPALVEAVIALVRDEAIEPLDLRTALAEMLWQWGKKEFAQRELDRWQQASAEGDAEDRVLAMRRLAEQWYRLREYRKAAAGFDALHALAAKAGTALTPADQYTRACVHALSGGREAAFAALAECQALLASPHLDSSLKLERKQFETDPELASLRDDPRFAAFLAGAFGERERAKNEAKNEAKEE